MWRNQYNNAGYFGSPSRELNLYPNNGTFDFISEVTDFGIDLRAYAGYPTVYDVQIYAADDITRIGSIGATNLSGNGIPVFFGYSGASIGKVVFNIQSGYVNFDNLSFGVAEAADVPEPASGLLLLAGLGAMGALARRRARSQA